MNFWCIFFLHKKYQGSLRRALVNMSNSQVWSHFLCWLLTGHGCTVLFLFCFSLYPQSWKPKAITHWFQTLKHCPLVQGSGTLQCHLGVVCWAQHTLYSYSNHLFPELGLQSYLGSLLLQCHTCTWTPASGSVAQKALWKHSWMHSDGRLTKILFVGK